MILVKVLEGRVLVQRFLIMVHVRFSANPVLDPRIWPFPGQIFRLICMRIEAVMHCCDGHRVRPRRVLCNSDALCLLIPRCTTYRIPLKAGRSSLSALNVHD